MGSSFEPIIACGDQHLPFLHRPTWEKIIEFTKLIFKNEKPGYFVFMGDLYDMYSYSRFTTRLNMSPKSEMEYARDQMEEMLFLLKKTAPQLKIYILRGNHDIRLASRVWEKFGSSLDHVLDGGLREWWNFPGVETIYDPKEVLKIQDISFIHGTYTKPGEHLKHMDFQNVVRGHSHCGGVYYHRIASGEVRWELDAGYIGDPFSHELNYRPMNKYFRWTHGLGFIDALGPRFIPMGEGDLWQRRKLVKGKN